MWDFLRSWWRPAKPDFPNAPWSTDSHDPWIIVDADGDKVADVSASLYKPGQGDLTITNRVYANQVRDAIIEASGGTI